MEKQLTIPEIKQEIKTQLTNKETFQALATITFNGLSQELMQRALLEGMMNGFTFQSFIKKDVYAIPFKNGYSLVNSIDHSRKIGMRSGVVGVSEPIYEEKDEKIISCSITVKRKIEEHIGEFTAKVYFDEYYKSNKYKNSLWDTKPRTMIAKVAEMHALRKACPEELSQSYIEEEFDKEKITQEEKEEKKEKSLLEYEKEMKEVKTIEELGKIWVDIPAEAKIKLASLKNELKSKLSNIIEGEIVK